MKQQSAINENKEENQRLNEIYHRKKSQLGLTQTKLGEMFDISQNAVSKYLRGEIPLNLDIALKFSEALQIPVSEFSPRIQIEMEKIEKKSQENKQFGKIEISNGNNINGNIHIRELNKYSIKQDDKLISVESLHHEVHLKTVPVFETDDAAAILLFPDENQEKIKNPKEQVVSLIANDRSTIGIKIGDNSAQTVSDHAISIGNTVFVEPLLIPKNNDLVLVCLDARSKKRRGIFAKLKVDLSNNRYLINDDSPTPIKMPTGAVICGVIIGFKRHIHDSDVVLGRYEANYNIWDSEETETEN